MHPNILLSSFALLPTLSLAAGGLYTKTSPVLQVDARNYEKLIGKSNYTSIVEFYAPWCGHCQNLKPAYEKAATSLAGLAKVAAINCDDETNKQFCGSMGVKGFPTLKIVKPAKKAGGRPSVEDYQGGRTARDINDAVIDKIPSHVARVKDDGFEAWLGANPDRPKAVFFSEKGAIGPLVKALAIDFLNAIDIAQIRATEKEVAKRYGVTSFPTVILVPGGDAQPIQHTGDMKKASLLTFLSQAAAPNPDAADPASQAQKSTPPKDKKKAKAPPAASAEPAPEASCPMGHTGANPHAAPASSSTPLDQDNQPPTASPNPATATDPSANPIHLPVAPAPPLATLEDESALQKTCLHTRASTCILAFPPASILAADAGADAQEQQTQHPGLLGLSEVAHKHRQRGAKLFPFYAVPDTNAAGRALLGALGLGAAGGDVGGRFEVVAVNAKKGWWARFEAPEGIVGREAIEGWVDNIRFGEMRKEQLPEGLVREIQEEATDGVGKEKKGKVAEQPIQIEIVELDDDGQEIRAEGKMGGTAAEQPIQIEVVELDDEEQVHDEL